MEVAISLLRHKRDLEVVCQPVFTETGGIEGETLYHPLLSNPIANDVHFQKNMVNQWGQCLREIDLPENCRHQCHSGSRVRLCLWRKISPFPMVMC